MKSCNLLSEQLKLEVKRGGPERNAVSTILMAHDVIAFTPPVVSHERGIRNGYVTDIKQTIHVVTSCIKVKQQSNKP